MHVRTTMAGCRSEDCGQAVAAVKLYQHLDLLTFQVVTMRRSAADILAYAAVLTSTSKNNRMNGKVAYGVANNSIVSVSRCGADSVAIGTVS